MVSVFTEIIKIKRLNISVSSLLNRTLTNFEYGSNNYCRHCGKKYMKPFEKYTRVLTDYHNGKIVDTIINTRRYQCKCGKTHVILPCLVVPYSRYSMVFIIYVLHDYYSGSLTKEEISSKYSISIPTIYRWKALFEKDKKIWLKELKDLETSASEYIRSLIDHDEINIFLNDFMKEVYPHRMFLQSHLNTYSHQYV